MAATAPRVLSASRPISGLPTAVDRLSDDPGTWLPAPARPAGPGRWRVRLRAGPAHKVVVVTVGGVWRSGETWSRPLDWEPADDRDALVPTSRWLPTFHGTLAVTETTDQAALTLRGTYVPPLGVAGTGIDAAGLHRVAISTAGAFLDAVGDALDAAAAPRPADPSRAGGTGTGARSGTGWRNHA